MSEKTRFEIEAEESLRQAIAVGRQMAAIADALFGGGKRMPKPEPLCVCGHDDSFHGGRGCVADECDCQDFRLPPNSEGYETKPKKEPVTGRCPGCGTPTANNGYCSGNCAQAHRRASAGPFTDSTKAGTIFEDHSCYRCDSGNKPCIKGKGREHDCDTLHARND